MHHHGPGACGCCISSFLCTMVCSSASNVVAGAWRCVGLPASCTLLPSSLLECKLCSVNQHVLHTPTSTTHTHSGITQWWVVIINCQTPDAPNWAMMMCGTGGGGGVVKPPGSAHSHEHRGSSAHSHVLTASTACTCCCCACLPAYACTAQHAHGTPTWLPCGMQGPLGQSGR
jgi:hypothetical protein